MLAPTTTDLGLMLVTGDGAVVGAVDKAPVCGGGWVGCEPHTTRSITQPAHTNPNEKAVDAPQGIHEDEARSCVGDTGGIFEVDSQDALYTLSQHHHVHKLLIRCIFNNVDSKSAGLCGTIDQKKLNA